mmetsp:Transcript_3435/g.8961  ORF Transcript_3435/g.8961 Transcript_3435/m.8961 type:complete len:249 (-) Transcript_3435:177-923(-)
MAPGVPRAPGSAGSAARAADAPPPRRGMAAAGLIGWRRERRRRTPSGRAKVMAMPGLPTSGRLGGRRPSLVEGRAVRSGRSRPARLRRARPLRRLPPRLRRRPARPLRSQTWLARRAAAKARRMSSRRLPRPQAGPTECVLADELRLGPLLARPPSWAGPSQLNWRGAQRQAALASRRSAVPARQPGLKPGRRAGQAVRTPPVYYHAPRGSAACPSGLAACVSHELFAGHPAGRLWGSGPQGSSTVGL